MHHDPEDWAPNSLASLDWRLAMPRLTLAVCLRRGDHGYIGKAYLDIGDLTMSEYHLQRLDLIVLFGCESFYPLKEAIPLYRVNQSG